jgi:hypothetical protein
MLVAKEGSGPPGWLPDYIAEKARELREKHSGNQIALDVIDRLVTHPKMQTVWKEFNKRSRENHQRTGRPLHELTERFAATADRNAALADFLEFACNLGRRTLELPLPNRTEATMAKALRADAERLERAGRKGARRLRRAAEVYERLQYKPGDRAKHIARGLALWLAAVFGSPMYQTTATVTSIITGREIDKREVRTWFQDPLDSPNQTLPKAI